MAGGLALTKYEFTRSAKLGRRTGIVFPEFGIVTCGPAAHCVPPDSGTEG